MLVRGVALLPDDFLPRISQGNAARKAERLRFLEAELAWLFDEEILVVIENQSHDAPHIVLEVRVVELHRPARPGRRKTPQHQQLRVGRKEKTERMSLYHTFASGFLLAFLLRLAFLVFTGQQDDIVNEIRNPLFRIT